MHGLWSQLNPRRFLNAASGMQYLIEFAFFTSNRTSRCQFSLSTPTSLLDALPLKKSIRLASVSCFPTQSLLYLHCLLRLVVNIVVHTSSSPPDSLTARLDPEVSGEQGRGKRERRRPGSFVFACWGPKRKSLPGRQCPVAEIVIE